MRTKAIHLLAVATSMTVYSQAVLADPSTVIVPYSSDANRTIGDSVNITFPYTPLGRCVDYEDDALVWDTGGAISSEGKITLVSVETEEKRTTNLALGFQAAGKVKAGVFNANSDFSFDMTSESFRSDQSKLVTLEFSSGANFGRRIIQDYRLDDEAPSPDADPALFLERCGTHFIRGERRTSDLTILIRIGSTSRQGKDALTATLKRTIGGGVSLKAISGDAGATFTASYKSIIEFAKKTGNVSIEYRAHGGPGIAAAGAAAQIVDPSDFAQLSAVISNVSAMFTQDNSGIDGYVLQSNTALGAPDFNINLERLEQIGALTRKLLMLNDAAARYEELGNRYPMEYETYFQTYGDTVNVARSELVELIKECAAGGSCVPPSDNILANLPFLEEMFVEADVSVSCQYQSATSILPVLNTPVSDPEILESISINVVGKSQNPDLVDFISTRIMRLTPKNEVIDVSEQFSGFALSEPNADLERSAFGTIYSENLRPKNAMSYDSSSRTYSIDTAALLAGRDSILGSAFSLYAPGPDGIKISYDAGFPPRTGCPVVRE